MTSIYPSTSKLMPDVQIQHAKAYPFFIPETSYVVDQDGWRPVDKTVRLNNPHRVIASGSNASPDRLIAKFKDVPDLLKNPISVTRAGLHNFDVVYSAHFTNYGSIPATLAYRSEAFSEVFVTWLDNAQLEHMHKTENIGVNYNYVHLTDIRLLFETGDVVNNAHAYLSARGCLSKDGETIPLSIMSQSDVLRHAMSLVEPDMDDLEAFISSHIESDQARSKHTKKLMETALKSMPD